MRGGYVDHIQVGPAHQLLWCVVAALQSMFVGEGGGPLSITGGDRDHALFGVLLQRAHKAVSDPSGTDHTPTHMRSKSRVGYAGLRKPVEKCHDFS
jgi:hypothetical protein